MSYHNSVHYNAVLNPNKPSVGVGLGLSGYKPWVSGDVCLFVCGVLESFRSKKKAQRRVRVLSARGLVLCFLPCPCAHRICYFRLKTTNFTFFTLFLMCFHEKRLSYNYHSNVWMTRLTKKTCKSIIFSSRKFKKLPE